MGAALTEADAQYDRLTTDMFGVQNDLAIQTEKLREYVGAVNTLRAERDALVAATPDHFEQLIGDLRAERDGALAELANMRDAAAHLSEDLMNMAAERDSLEAALANYREAK